MARLITQQERKRSATANLLNRDQDMKENIMKDTNKRDIGFDTRVTTLAAIIAIAVAIPAGSAGAADRTAPTGTLLLGETPTVYWVADAMTGAPTKQYGLRTTDIYRRKPDGLYGGDELRRKCRSAVPQSSVPGAPGRLYRCLSAEQPTQYGATVLHTC